MRIQPAKIPENMGEVAKLVVEYAESLNFGLCFQGFEEELSSLPGGYAPPRGQFLLARAGKAVAGGVFRDIPYPKRPVMFRHPAGDAAVEGHAIAQEFFGQAQAAHHLEAVAVGTDQHQGGALGAHTIGGGLQ